MSRPTLATILVIDDEPDMRALVRVALETISGVRVLAAADGPAGIQCAKTEQPQLILLDATMPDMDGPAVLAALRAHARTDSIPVVFLTARSRPNEVASLLAHGAAAVLTKPFDPRALPGRVARLWEEIQAAREKSLDQA